MHEGEKRKGTLQVLGEVTASSSRPLANRQLVQRPPLHCQGRLTSWALTHWLWAPLFNALPLGTVVPCSSLCAGWVTPTVLEGHGDRMRRVAWLGLRGEAGRAGQV